MHYLHFGETEKSTYPICLLVPRIQRDEIRAAYIDPFEINQDDVMVIDLHQSQTAKKTPTAEQKQYIEEELAPVLNDLQVEYLLVADADYFKTLTKSSKVEAHLGYILPCVFGDWKVVYLPNYRQIFYDPEKVKAKIALGMQAVLKDIIGNYQTPGASIIKFAAYPSTVEEIEQWLERLIVENRPLTCDIETFDLKHHSAGIGTITFCWSKHEGIAFAVDYDPIPGAIEAPFGRQTYNARIRKALLSFFQRFKNKIIYHGISFDAYVLIYQLFMKDLLDTEGLLRGLEIMLRNWDCTKLITYLATNSCAGNKLGLKVQAQEFAGNYAVEEIKDITCVPLPELLQYNLVDGLSTWYTHEKHWQTVINDAQEDIYVNLFKPAMVDIIQMQLTGMPVNIKRAKEVNVQLSEELEDARQQILNSKIVQQYTYRLNEKWVEKKNATLKKKRVTMADAKEEFNPNSDDQMRDLLFEFLGLPVINLTKNKLASTDGESIEALLNRTQDRPDVQELLKAYQLYSIIGTLTTNFMPAILGAVEGPDGWHYLFGNFNLGGTLSGRLSSSDPNLQNLPSTGKGHKIKLKYAKLIKSCFEAPPGWLFVGIDFSSLEDKISALTTKDPNKLKVYTDGYDGHSMRAYAYWPEKMPDIDPNSIDSINSISKKYKPLRDKSKNPTFTLTYQGTEHALVKKYGFTREEALEIVARYKALYQVSIDWVDAQLDQAMVDGYVTVAFGLRVRTPLLKQVIRGTSKTPYEAEAEGRTAGNALGQSWCLLNSRAGVEFNQKVRNSPYRLDIRPMSQIHDAQYHLVRDDIDALMFTNEHLVKAVQWQEDPLIAHDEVKLGGELSIFHPTWNDEIGIPNGAMQEQIFAIVAEVSSGK